MKKLLLFAGMLILISACSIHRNSSPRIKEVKLYSIGFYNLENLYDTIDDPLTKDEDFLPEGRYQWNSQKYQAKLTNLAQVLSEMGRDRTPDGPAFFGVAEVENLAVLQDLVSQPALAADNYGIVHYDTPDARGIDCALLYNPKQFQIGSSILLPYVYKEPTERRTRGFLLIAGKLAGEEVAVLVMHWPSRGNDVSERIHAGRQVRAITDSLLTVKPGLKIIAMGDLNDDPMDESIARGLGAQKTPEGTGSFDLYNPFWKTLEDDGIGTLMYRGKWNLFDQILVSASLVRENRGGLRYESNEVFIRDYLLQEEGDYKGAPKRTHAGIRWLNGYSDHLPTLIYLTTGK